MPIPIQNQETRRGGPRAPKRNPRAKPKKLISLLIKCIVMALVLSLFLLFLLFLGFAALVLLHFLVSSTAFGRRHRFPPRPQTASLFEDSLPCVSYDEAEQTAKDCAICLETFSDGEFCRNLPGCGHLFHARCVDSWLTRVLNCPICRTRVRVHPGNSGSGISDDDWKAWWAVGVSG